MSNIYEYMYACKYVYIHIVVYKKRVIKFMLTTLANPNRYQSYQIWHDNP